MSGFEKDFRKTTTQLSGPSSKVRSEPNGDVMNNNNASASLDGSNVKGNLNVIGRFAKYYINWKSKPNLNKIFRLIDIPIQDFVGRKDLLCKIHRRLEECSSKSQYYERIVILHGFGGIGKSEAAREYAEEYKNKRIVKNVAWIDSENETSLKRSFVSLAKKLKLDIPSELDKIDAEQLAKDVYQYFSDHVHKGLFIFDHALQMKTSNKYFGISKYLPTQSLKSLPLILITTRTNNWEIPTESIIRVEELSQEEAVTFLEKKLKLTQEQLHTSLVLNSVCELAVEFQGYPLGLNLAASNIGNNKWSDLCSEIGNYLKRMKRPKKQGKCVEETLSEGDPNSYPLLMDNVWDATFNKIEAKGKVGEESMQLLKLMAYMPSDEIEMEKIKNMFLCIFNKELQNDCFSILNEFALISIHEKKYKNSSNEFQIRIHRLVQYYTRTKLEEKKDDEIVIEYCLYLSQHDPVRLHEVFVYLKNYWPENTFLIQFSILFCSGGIKSEEKELRNSLRFLFEYFQENYSQHFMLQKNDLDDNQVKLMMLSLYHYHLFKEGLFGDDVKLQDPQINKQEITDFVMIIFKSYFEYLLQPYAIIPTNNVEFCGAEHVHQMCYRIFNNEYCENKSGVTEPLRRLIELANSGQFGFGRKETTNELYMLFQMCLHKNRGCNSLLSTYWNVILETHKHVYLTIDQNSEKYLKNYWKHGGPIDYEADWNLGTTSFVPVYQQNAFLFDGFCDILEHYAQFYSVYYDGIKNGAIIFGSIMTLVMKMEYPEKLISHGLFMKHFHSFVIQHFSNMDVYDQLDCLVTFMGFFSKKKELRDKDGFNWSINCVAAQTKVFYSHVVAKKSRKNNYFGQFLNMRTEFVKSFIELNKNDNDPETKMALDVAAHFIGK